MENFADIHRSATSVQPIYAALTASHSPVARDSSRHGVVSPQGHDASVGDKLRAEGQLLAGGKVLDGLAHSVAKLNNEKLKTALEVGVGVGVGVALNLLDKNPASKVVAGMKIVNKVFMGAFALDVGTRVGEPMYSVWKDPSSVAANQVKLGDNVGEFVTNFGVSIGGGFAIAAIADRLALTRVGTFLQGYKETKTDLSSLNPAMQEIFAKNKNVGNQYRVRTFEDGTEVGTSGTKVVVSAPNGLAFNFDRRESLLGFKSSVKLNSISEPSGPFSALSGSADYIVQGGRVKAPFGIKDASHIVSETQGGRLYEFENGLKISTDKTDKIKQVASAEGILQKHPNNVWSYVRGDIEDLVAKTQVPQESARNVFADLSKVTKDQATVRQVAVSTFDQMILRAAENRVLDMGADKVLHELVLDHVSFEKKK